MALIDQKSDLKELKHANFATYSTPPIVKDINDPPTYNRFSKRITARADDLVRMSRLLTANSGKLSPTASNFLANQGIIATVNAINATKKQLQGDSTSFPDTAFLDAAKNTGKAIAGLLAQTPVAGTGVHFIYAPAVGTQYLKESGQSNRGGLGRFLQGVAQLSGIAGGGGVDGAKAALAGATIIADSKPIEGSLPNLNIEFEDNAAVNRVDEDEGSIKSIFEKSKLRAGLDKLSNTTNYQKNKTRDGSFGQILNGEYLNFFGETSLLPPRVEKPDGTVQYLNGFEEEDKVNTPENILNKNKTSRLNLNAREQEKSKLDVDGKFDKEFGKITEQKRNKPIYVKANRSSVSKGIIYPDKVSTNPNFSGYTSDQVNLFGGGGETINDSFLTSPIPSSISEIIPFEFQVFDPKRGGNAQYLYFRAYLDSFADNYTGNWNGTKYIGRAEEVYNYTGFDREVTFDFKIAALTSQELRPLYRKLNFFAGVTAPSYDTNGSFMRGVYTKVSIGDYLQAVPGFFSSINLSWDTNYPWEIGFDADGEENDVPRNPTILNVSTTFKPIHNFNPELGQSFIGSSRSVNAQ